MATASIGNVPPVDNAAPYFGNKKLNEPLGTNPHDPMQKSFKSDIDNGFLRPQKKEGKAMTTTKPAATKPAAKKAAAKKPAAKKMDPKKAAKLDKTKVTADKVPGATEKTAKQLERDAALAARKAEREAAAAKRKADYDAGVRPKRKGFQIGIIVDTTLLADIDEECAKVNKGRSELIRDVMLSRYEKK